jgi:hypothetical protein
MVAIPGVRVTGPIVPTDTSDVYATHEAQYGKGGYHEVANAAALAALALLIDRLEIGMLVKQVDIDSFFTWNGGAFVAQTFGAGGVDTETIRFEGNGIFPIDTRVDGAWIAPAACTITRVAVDVGERGDNGGGVTDTIWDIHQNGVTMYTTQANRPTIAAAGGGGEAKIVAALPDIVAIAQNDRITIDTDQVSDDPALLPSDFSIIIKVVY